MLKLRLARLLELCSKISLTVIFPSIEVVPFKQKKQVMLLKTDLLQNISKIFATDVANYSRMDQVKFVEDNL